MNSPTTTRCLFVNQHEDQISRMIESRPLNEWPEGDVVVRVNYSSLNFKDALAASGNPGVARSLPIVPGIDAVGTIKMSDDSRFKEGQGVYIAHPDFGTSCFGGWSEWVRVPSTWVHALPSGMTARDFMIYGTAGFTAGQCVAAILADGIQPGDGEVIVTGATGGVGIFAVMMLAKLGYQVVVSTGKPERADWLRERGAAAVISREETNDDSKRPLLSGRWAAAVDTVGGNTLATIIRSSKLGACVTACGVVGGAELPLTVYPFILRGVSLRGIDSAGVSEQTRSEIWSQVAGPWSCPDLESIVTEVDLDGLDEQVEQILQGKIAGRVLVELGQLRTE